MLLENKIKVLVATVALGMGFDKPDIGFVIHYQRPGSLVSYYQQVGRAGRNIDEAYAILLSGKEDDEIAEYFIETAFPSEVDMEEVLKVIEESEDGCSLPYLCINLNLSKRKIEQCIKHLSIEGAIIRDNSKYYRTPRPWKPDIEKVKQITQQRYDELEEIKKFMESDECLMQLVCKKLDDPEATSCGKCANCSDDFLVDVLDQNIVQEAVEYIRGNHHTIEPRRRWPSYNSIPKDRLNERGRALCVYGDAGWGKMVKEDKYELNHFSDELVKRTAQMIESWLKPLPKNLWVTPVPSLRRPQLVPSFASRLAQELKLPYQEVVEKVKDTPPQKEMANSEQQLQNVMDAFEIINTNDGPVLLIDDMVDSRWTLTICGFKLKESGSGPVYPVALAVATNSSDN